MILKRLYLKNFLIHDETKIEFSDKGITVFIGENGAGKSSIIEGISFALFGKSDKGNQVDLVKWGKKQAVVELEFQKGKEIFKIERTIEIKGSKASSTGVIYKKQGSRFIPYFQKNISKEIPKLTGITGKTFSTSILVKQGDIEGLLRLSPRERAKVFEDILDMTLYQLLADKAAEKRKELEKVYETLGTSLPDIQEIQKQLKEKKEKLKELLSEKETLLKKINDLKEKSNLYQKQIEKVLEEKSTNQQLKEKVKNIKETIKRIENQLKENENLLEQILEKEKTLPQLEEEISDLKQFEKVLEDINRLEKLTEKLIRLEEKEKELKEKEAFVKENQQIYTDYLEKEKEYRKILEEINQISKIEGQIKNIKQEIEELKGEVVNTQKEALKIASKLIEYKKIYKTLELNPVLIDQFIRNNKTALDEYSVKKEELLKKLTELETEGKQLKKEIDSLSKLKGTCPTCKRPVEEHTKEELLKELQEALTEKREKYKEIKQELAKIEEKISVEKKVEPLLEDFKRLFDKHKEADKKLNQLKSKLFVVEREYSKKKDITNLKSHIEDFLSKHKDLYIRYREALSFLEKTDKEKIEKEVSSIRKEIEELKKSVSDYSKEELKEKIDKLRTLEKKYISTLEFVKQKKSVEKSILSSKEEISSLSKKAEELSRKIIEKDFDKELHLLKEKLARTDKDLGVENEKLTVLMEDIGRFQTEIKALEKEIVSYEENKKKQDELIEKINKYKTIEFALGNKGIQRIIRDNALYKLPKIVNVIFSAFDFPFHQVRFSENFDINLLAPTVEKTDRYVNINSVSGGQRVALGLALRIAISRFLSNRADFLILDEPTIHLDNQRRGDLINILIELKEKGLINQLIVVTHDTEIEDAADSIYYVERGTVRLIN